MMDTGTFWFITLFLGIGTYLIRFSFLGLLGGRTLPDWLLTHLRYVGVAVLPAMVTPMVLWPAATGGAFDPLRLAAALVAIAVGWRFGVIACIFAGMGALWAFQFVLG